MSLNENADIDTSQIDDRRGSGGGGGGGGGLGGLPIPIPMGGGKSGIIISIVVLLGLLFCGGGFGLNSILGDSGSGTGDNRAIEEKCAKENLKRFDEVDCRNTLYINSIQAYWTQAAQPTFGIQYQQAKTVFFSQGVSTACGQADSGVGPFYCPGDKQVYIDLTFYNELANRFGAKGRFAEAYVLAHEYGHHMQTLNGTEAKVRQQQRGGSENELSVRMELQADCLAGTWAHHATETKDRDGDAIFTEVTDAQINEALEAAAAIGDDAIQQQSGGRIDESKFTHGSSAQRQKWFKQGFTSGDGRSCDTFSGAV